MSLMIPKDEIAVGDYSPIHGHVKTVVERDGDVTVTFINGDVVTLSGDGELELDQGGRF